MGLLTSFNPYVLYIKLALISAALIGTGWTVHTWDKRGYEAAQLKATQVAAATYEKSAKAYEAKIVELQQDSDEAVGKYQSRIAALTTDNQTLNRKIKNASQKQPACALTAGTVWVWNDSTNRANGHGVPADSEDTSGVLSSDGRITDTTIQDLLANHDAVTQVCGKWKAQIDSIIDWNNKHK